MLAAVIAVAGVRGAVVVSADDGLVVREAALEGVATGDVAALASAVARRAGELLAGLGDGAVRLCTLAAERGTVLAAQGPDGLWLVAVTGTETELGRLRLLLGDLAPELG